MIGGPLNFRYFTSLEEVSIPYNIELIPVYCFYGCEKLTSINIPYGIKSIGSCAFANCSSLKEINIPESLLSIEEIYGSPFTNCLKLEAINVDENNEIYISIQGIIYDKETRRMIWAPQAIEGDIIIPQGTSSITSFANRTHLTSISIPNGTNILYESQFNGCTNLKYVIIPNSITNIATSAFGSCDNLRYILYKGSAEEWQNISISYIPDLDNPSTNDLQDCLIFYYSEEEPDESGNFWHYDNGTPTIWHRNQDDKETITVEAEYVKTTSTDIFEIEPYVMVKTSPDGEYVPAGTSNSQPWCIESQSRASGGYSVGGTATGYVMEVHFYSEFAGQAIPQIRAASCWLKKDDGNWSPRWMGDIVLAELFTAEVNGQPFEIPSSNILEGSGSKGNQEPNVATWYSWNTAEFGTIDVQQGWNTFTIKFKTTAELSELPVDSDTGKAKYVNCHDSYTLMNIDCFYIIFE